MHLPLTCTELIALFSAYLGDDSEELVGKYAGYYRTPARVREAFVAHVRGCERCRDKLTALELFIRFD